MTVAASIGGRKILGVDLVKMKRLLSYLLTIGLIGYLGWGGWYVYGKATNPPSKVRVTNLTARSATVSWVTDTYDVGDVAYRSDNDFAWGPLARFGSDIAHEDRDTAVAILDHYDKTGEPITASDVKVKKRGKHYVHHVTITDLDPQTEYSFRVGNGVWWWDETGVIEAVEDEFIPDADIFTFSTLPALDSVPAPDPAFGQVLSLIEKDGYIRDNDNVDAVIYASVYSLEGEGISNNVSSVTNYDGGWTLDKSNFRSVEDQNLLGSVRDGSAVLRVMVQLEDFNMKGPYQELWGDDEPFGAINVGTVRYGEEGNVLATLRNVFVSKAAAILPCGPFEGCDGGPMLPEDDLAAIAEYEATQEEAEEEDGDDDDDDAGGGGGGDQPPPDTAEDDRKEEEDEARANRQQAAGCKNPVAGGCTATNRGSNTQCYCANADTGGYDKVPGNCFNDACASGNSCPQVDGVFDPQTNTCKVNGQSYSGIREDENECIADGYMWDKEENECNRPPAGGVNTEGEGPSTTSSPSSSGQVCCGYPGGDTGWETSKDGNCSLGESPLDDSACTPKDGSVCCELLTESTISGQLHEVRVLSVTPESSCQGSAGGTTRNPLRGVSSSACVGASQTPIYNVVDGQMRFVEDVNLCREGRGCDIGVVGSTSVCVEYTIDGESSYECVYENAYDKSSSDIADPSEACGANECGVMTIETNSPGIGKLETQVVCGSCSTNEKCETSGNSGNTKWPNVCVPAPTGCEECTGTQACFPGRVGNRRCVDAVVEPYRNPSRSSPDANVMTTAYAAIAVTAEDGLLFFPEAGYYQVDIGDGPVSVMGDGEEGTLLYYERNGIPGYQAPYEINEVQDDEDLLIDYEGIEVNVSKIADVYTYEIKAGVNVVSLPFFPTQDGTLALMASDLMELSNEVRPYVDSVSYFEQGKWAGGLKYSDGGDKGVDFPLEFGKGYIIVANDDYELRIPGNAIETPIPLAFKPGWNLVGVHGYPTNYTAHSFANGVTTIEGLEADNVTKWDTSKGRYEGIQIYNDALYGFDYPIAEDLGYFVRISDFTPESPSTKSIIWNPGGELHGEPGSK